MRKLKKQAYAWAACLSACLMGFSAGGADAAAGDEQAAVPALHRETVLRSLDSEWVEQLSGLTETEETEAAEADLPLFAVQYEYLEADEETASAYPRLALALENLSESLQDEADSYFRQMALGMAASIEPELFQEYEETDLEISGSDGLPYKGTYRSDVRIKRLDEAVLSILVCRSTYSENGGFERTYTSYVYDVPSGKRLGPEDVVKDTDDLYEMLQLEERPDTPLWVLEDTGITVYTGIEEKTFSDPNAADGLQRVSRLQSVHLSYEEGNQLFVPDYVPENSVRSCELADGETAVVFGEGDEDGAEVSVSISDESDSQGNYPIIVTYNSSVLRLVPGVYTACQANLVEIGSNTWLYLKTEDGVQETWRCAIRLTDGQLAYLGGALPYGLEAAAAFPHTVTAIPIESEDVFSEEIAAVIEEAKERARLEAEAKERALEEARAAVAERMAAHEPFYGIWCSASKNEAGLEKAALSMRENGWPLAEVYLTSEWSNLNTDPWYSIAVGYYLTKEDAEEDLAAVQQSGYPTAYIRYSGEYTANPEEPETETETEQPAGPSRAELTAMALEDVRQEAEAWKAASAEIEEVLTGEMERTRAAAALAAAKLRMEEHKPFYGIWCSASKNEPGMLKMAETMREKGWQIVQIYRTDEWTNLNKETWYSMAVGYYETQEEAEAELAAVRQSGYPTAYIRYSGDFIESLSREEEVTEGNTAGE